MATEAEINPFRPGGLLAREADVIIKNSTISRDTVIINDPSLRRPNGSTTANSTSGLSSSSIKPSYVGDVCATPTRHTSNGHAAKESTPPTADAAGPVTYEVTAGHVSPLLPRTTYEQQRVEHVKIKSPQKPGKCCVLQ